MGQYAWVIDVTMVLMMMGLTWVVASEGLWGSALMFINVMLAGLVAFCLFEPCAKVIDANLGFMAQFSDFVTLLVLFCIAFTLIRLATDMLGPTLLQFPGWLDQVGRFVFGAITAWYMVGMLLCIVETAPIHKMFLGYQWQTHAFWNVGVDRFWLGFVQWSTDRTFDWDNRKVPFDANSDFIVRYHNHRGFGDPDPAMPGAKKTAEAAPAEGSAPAGSQSGGGQAGGGQGGGRPPYDPTGATQQPPGQ